MKNKLLQKIGLGILKKNIDQVIHLEKWRKSEFVNDCTNLQFSLIATKCL